MTDDISPTQLRGRQFRRHQNPEALMFFSLGSLLSLSNLRGEFLVVASELTDSGEQIIECRQFESGRLDSTRLRFASDRINVERCWNFDIEANLRRCGLIK